MSSSEPSPAPPRLAAAMIGSAGVAVGGLALGVATGGVVYAIVGAIPILGVGGLWTWRRRAFGREESAEREGALERTSEWLQHITAVVHESVSSLHRASERIATTRSEIAADAARQREAIAGAAQALERVTVSAGQIEQTVTGLGSNANETAAAVSALDGSIWQIAENTDELRHTMEEAASATSELAAAVGEIAQGAEHLGESSDATHERIGRLERSVRSVESNAAETHRVSEDALGHAREGIERVRELSEGMREIDESFHGVQETIDRLAERSASIDDIVGLIDEVVSRTHLLALNASIIAAQAGEQGRAFSVVASEVRDLADLTANSTKEIAGHVAAVREQVDGAVEAVEIGAARVAAGRLLSDAAETSLQQIHDGSEQATAMTREIATATEEQSTELVAVETSMGQVAGLVRQIGDATREQNASSRLVLGKLDEMRELAQVVAETCSRQAGDSRQITEAAATLAAGIEEIRSGAAEQALQGKEVLAGLRTAEELATAGARHTELLDASVRELEAETGRLVRETERTGSERTGSGRSQD